MKKACMILATALCAGQLCAKAPANRLIELHTMEKGHKIDWLNFKVQCTTKKTDLMKNEIGDWVDFANKHVAHAAQNRDCSPAAIDKHMEAKLNEAVALHKKHKAAWRKLMNEEHEKMLKLADKHDDELGAFEEKEEKAEEKEAMMKKPATMEEFTMTEEEE